MKRLVILIALIFPIWASADVPKKQSPNRYASLVTNSPFTSKPEIVNEIREEIDLLADYSLGGVTKLQDGYYTVLVNVKNQNALEVVGQKALEDVKVVEVTYSDDNDWKKTTVTLEAQGKRQTMGFEDKNLKVKVATPAPAASAAANAPQPTAAPPSGTDENGRRLPRTRKVPKPNQGNTPGATPQSNRPPLPTQR